MEKSNQANLNNSIEHLKNKNYTEALSLLEDIAAEYWNDSYHRLKADCFRGLNKSEQALVSLKEIKRPKAEDLEKMSIALYVNKDYPEALKAIDKSILLEDSAYARFIRGQILSKGLNQSNYYELTLEEIDLIIEEYKKADAFSNVFPTLYIEWSEVASCKGHWDTRNKIKLEILEHGLTKCKGTAPELREKIAEIKMWHEPEQAFIVLQPILNVQPEKNSYRFILAAQAALRAKRFEDALTQLQALPEDIKSLPGYFPILADTLFSIEKDDEAWELWDLSIISDSPDAQVYGLLGRAKACFQSKDYSRARNALENVVKISFENNLLTEPFQSPYFQREFYYYEGAKYYDFIHEVVKLEKSDKIFGADLYNKLRYWSFVIEVGYTDVTDVLTEDAEDMDKDEVKRHNETARKVRNTLIAFSELFSHPHLSEKLSEVYTVLGEWERAIVHGLYSARWKYSILKNKYRISACYFNDDVDIDKNTALNIHKICLKALSEAKSPDEVDYVFSSTYASAWGKVLKKFDLIAEVREATSVLVSKNPEAQHWDAWWDYAYYSDKTDSKYEQRQEYGYRKLLEHEPNNASAAHNLALVLKRTNRISEAWEFSKKAFSLAPNDKTIRSLYEQLFPKFEYQELLRDQSKIALTNPVMLEHLNARDRLYLAAFLRCCLTEDGKKILPANLALRKIAPTPDYTDLILTHLFKLGVLVINPTTPSDVISCLKQKNGKIKISLIDSSRVDWILNIRSLQAPEDLSTDFLTELLDPPVLSDEEEETIGVELWHEVSVEECLEHLHQFRSEVNLESSIGEKTREIFSDLMRRHSASQNVGIIKKKVPECLAAFESRKLSSRKLAANLVPSNCQSYSEFLATKSWTPPINSRHPKCEQSVISKILFDRMLEIGSDGFIKIPGDFAGA